MEFKFDTVRIFTRDWERALAFYSETLGIPVHFADAAMGWAQLDVGGVFLAVEKLAHDDPEADDLVGRFLAVSLEVDDIESAHRTLVERGVRFVEPPTEQPWGGVLAHLEDPDGNVLTLLGA
ncbi:MAG: VOC family protein [Myxococcota bacterium]